jgi:hypothetical protein
LYSATRYHDEVNSSRTLKLDHTYYSSLAYKAINNTTFGSKFASPKNQTMFTESLQKQKNRTIYQPFITGCTKRPSGKVNKTNFKLAYESKELDSTLTSPRP